MTRLVVATYESFYVAKKALSELNECGFESDFIKVTRQEKLGKIQEERNWLQLPRTKSEIVVDEVKAGGVIGTGIGAALGLTVWMLVYARALTLPGIELRTPLELVILLFGSLFTGALIGLIPGLLLGGSIGTGIPEAELEEYARLACQVPVDINVFTDRAAVDQVKEILNHYNPLDLQEETLNQTKPGWMNLQAQR